MILLHPEEAGLGYSSRYEQRLLIDLVWTLYPVQDNNSPALRILDSGRICQTSFQEDQESGPEA